MTRKPTLQQLRYLRSAYECQKLGKKCSVVKVASENNVTHGPVSRFFKECIQNGDMTKDYRLTFRGLRLFHSYQKVLEALPEYLSRMGLRGKEIETGIQDMVENLSLTTLNAMLNQEQIYQEERRQYDQSLAGSEVPTQRVKNLLKLGRYPVDFLFLKLGAKDRGRSMADRGFEKPGILRCGRKYVWLDLTICDMEGQSRKSGERLIGHLQSFKYLSDGELKKLDIKENKVHIPFEAFRFICLRKGHYIGILYTTMTCSVGEIHMPESTAQLIFWL